MSVQLLGKKELKRLSSVANDGAGAGYNGFAKGMMAKMGWAEGQGLGKDMQGRSTYVQVKKKEDNAGLGKEKAKQNDVNDQWYFNAFDSALANMGGKKKKKKDKKGKKGKKDKGGSDEVADEAGGSMYDKMFKATGGARMGMRARASQNGKLARTEGDDNGSNAVPTEDVKSEERKRPAEANGDAEKAIDSQEAAVAVKMEKPLGKKRRRKTWGEGEEDATVAKAERKRDRLAAKKAKKEDTVMAEVVVGNGVARVKDEGVGQEKATKKKNKKRAGKEA